MGTKMINFIKKQNARDNISYISFHLVYSLIIYYILFLIGDIIGQGVLSRFVKGSLLIGLLFFFSFLLGLTQKKEKVKRKKIKNKLISLFSFIVFIILLLALYPHDEISAFVISFLASFLIIFNFRKKIKKLKNA